MTALAAEAIRRHSSPIGQSHGVRYLAVRTALGIIYPGSIIMQRTGEVYVEKVTKVADGTVLGWADIPFAVDTSLYADGAKIIAVRDGIVGPLATLGSGDAVTAAKRNKIVYMEDDNTVAATTDTAARSCLVRVDRVDSEGIYILIGREQI